MFAGFIAGWIADRTSHGLALMIIFSGFALSLMAFVYDPTDEFEKYVNPESVIWQKIESKYWAEYLKNMIVLYTVFQRII